MQPRGFLNLVPFPNTPPRSRRPMGLEPICPAGMLTQLPPRSVSSIPRPTGHLHTALVRFLSPNPSRLPARSPQDLTRELQPQNLPATPWQYPS
jgi:hypothetical protein